MGTTCYTGWTRHSFDQFTFLCTFSFSLSLVELLFSSQQWLPPTKFPDKSHLFLCHIFGLFLKHYLNVFFSFFFSSGLSSFFGSFTLVRLLQQFSVVSHVYASDSKSLLHLIGITFFGLGNEIWLTFHELTTDGHRLTASNTLHYIRVYKYKRDLGTYG